MKELQSRLDTEAVKDQIEHLCWQCLLGCETTRGLPRKSVLMHQGVSVQAGQLWGGKGGWSCKG